jgi:hypothetical protein
LLDASDSQEHFPAVADFIDVRAGEIEHQFCRFDEQQAA